MKKIIINVTDDITPIEALLRVAASMSTGVQDLEVPAYDVFGMDPDADSKARLAAADLDVVVRGGDDISIDDDAPVSHGDGGAWVGCWVWVADSESEPGLYKITAPGGMVLASELTMEEAQAWRAKNPQTVAIHGGIFIELDL